MIELLREYYGTLFEEKLIEEINKVAQYRKIPQGTVLIEVGDYIKSIPLLLTGAIKIIREDAQGNELFLYYLEGGDTCAMSLTCCIAQKKSEIRAVAEDNTELMMIPTHYMDHWLTLYPSWRRFIFQSYNLRLDEMLETIDSIAFKKMDERLLKYLKDKAMVIKSTTIHYTHQEIAYELNTSRVVISRLLKQLEKQGYIRLSRNKLELLKL
ncbi:Crp/Fnr family transcriptional regulator [Rapidithrix thailandica]|uniref:Crp/Fnr family transcriptional regulator n=1 Tax=Rapidithrix thailandica TaxID=413964 RepID=A0AAW9SJF0_9BACT